MKIVLIAHNQLQLVKRRLMELHELEGVEADDIVIADNVSRDGLVDTFSVRKHIVI